MWRRWSRVQVLSLVLVALLLTDPAWAWGKKGSSSSKTSSSSSSSSSSSRTKTSSSSSSSSLNKPSSTSPKTKTQPSYPRQPSSGGTSYGGQPNPYPKGGSYPGVGTNTNQQNPGTGGTGYGGNTNQQYPGRGGTPNQQYPGYPNQPGAGNYPNQQYPGRGGTPNQQYPGYPNQPGAGNYPNQQYPGRGGTPNQQYPGYPNQPGGTYPNQQYPGRDGGYPNQQNPGVGGYPNQQYPGTGGTNYGGYPNQQYPGAGYPNQQYPGRGGTNYGGYPNQPYPAAGGRYPAGGGYGWGQGGGYGYGGGGGYSNWNPNPNNKILSPRYGGGFRHGGGSAFSDTVARNNFKPSVKSKGFVKKAMLAAGVGAVAGMAVGYGLGRFPLPHFSLRSPSEEMYYNRYMYERYGQRSTDDNDYREYVYKPDKNYQTYEQHMDNCMKRTDLLRPEKNQPSSDAEGKVEDLDRSSLQSDQPPGMNDTRKDLNISSSLVDANANSTVGNTDPVKSAAMATEAPEADSAIRRDKRSVANGDDDAVSIMEIGYPALIDQLKSRRCVELYMGYSERFLQKQSQIQGKEQDQRPNPRSRGDTSGRPLALILTTSVMLLCSSVLLH